MISHNLWSKKKTCYLDIKVTYKLFSLGHVRHKDGGTDMSPARSIRRISNEADPLKLGKVDSPRASESILKYFTLVDLVVNAWRYIE